MARPMHRRTDMPIDRTLAGARCHVVRPILHHSGCVRVRVEGTVRYATENLGRVLLRVDFDTGASLIVLSDDIAIDDATPE
jgi:hypothetical protein